MYTHIEDYIYELYTSIGVKNPNDLDMRFIAKQLGVEIIYQKRAFRLNNEILLTNGTRSEEWVEFGHEICHFLRHVGNQLKMPPLFRELQEWQADYFAYHFCVPTFMLLEFEFPKYSERAIQQIALSFNVTIDFARKRFNMYKNKQYQQTNFSYSQIADKSHAYSTNQITDSDILNDEFYETFNLEINATEKMKDTIEFWHYIARRNTN